MTQILDEFDRDCRLVALVMEEIYRNPSLAGSMTQFSQTVHRCADTAVVQPPAYVFSRMATCVDMWEAGYNQKRLQGVREVVPPVAK